jgi:predicted RNA-binding protein Jag
MATTLTRSQPLPKRFERGCLKKLDQRTELAKRLNAVFQTIIDDLGGLDTLSHTRVALVERFVWLEHTLQLIEQRIATQPKRSEELLSKWIQGLNSLQGLAKTIGLKRERKTIDLERYKERHK